VAHGLNLFALAESAIRNVGVNHQDTYAPKVHTPPPLSFTHPVVKPVGVSQLIRNVAAPHIFVVGVIDVEPQKFHVLYLPCFHAIDWFLQLHPLDRLTDRRQEMNWFLVIV
jgi:hypothetical protein